MPDPEAAVAERDRALASPGDGVRVRVLWDEAEWDAIRGDWNRLYSASPAAAPPLHFDWLRSWWRVYGMVYGAEGLRIVTVWRGATCIGALPLYLGRRTLGPLSVRELRFLSTGEAEDEEICPDYMNLLCLAGEESACCDAMWKAIARFPWDSLELQDIPADSPILEPEHTAHVGRARTTLTRRGICPVADLGDGFEAYLKRLSPKVRQHARQYLRAAERSGAVFELASESSIDEFFDDLIRLHQERWTSAGKPGCFAAARFTEFHRGLARAWIPEGRAVLARLSHGGEAYAVLYGFLSGAKCDFYQSGIRRTETGPFESPGTTANLMLMRALTERGIAAYDFLRGSASYKQQLATTQNPLGGIQVWRPTVRMAVFGSVRLGGRLMRRGWAAAVRG